ncbi:MAG TPA: hypothetical protein VF251_11690 [Pyrinomonadaceae bacterium]
MLLIIFVLVIPGIAAAVLDQSTTVAVKQTKALTVSEPTFKEYRGVKIGMTATDVRQKLGDPKIKDKAQDFFAFGDNESAQFFYDAEQKVYAISIDFTGKSAPTALDVLGEEVTPKADGSLYRIKQYPTAGYWVSYNRTSGDAGMVSVTIQKLGLGKKTS